MYIEFQSGIEDIEAPYSTHWLNYRCVKNSPYHPFSNVFTSPFATRSNQPQTRHRQQNQTAQHAVESVRSKSCNCSPPRIEGAVKLDILDARIGFYEKRTAKTHAMIYLDQLYHKLIRKLPATTVTQIPSSNVTTPSPRREKLVPVTVRNRLMLPMDMFRSTSDGHVEIPVLNPFIHHQRFMHAKRKLK